MLKLSLSETASDSSEDSSTVVSTSSPEPDYPSKSEKQTFISFYPRYPLAASVLTFDGASNAELALLIQNFKRKMEVDLKYLVEFDAVDNRVLACHDRQTVAEVLNKPLNLSTVSSAFPTRSAIALDFTLHELIAHFESAISHAHKHSSPSHHGEKSFRVILIMDTSDLQSRHLRGEARKLRSPDPSTQTPLRHQFPFLTESELYEDASTLDELANLYPPEGTNEGLGVIRRILIAVRAEVD